MDSQYQTLKFPTIHLKIKKVLTFRTIKSLNVNTGKKIICTFAHGDEELRTKSDNMLSNQPQLGLGFMPMAMDNFQTNPYIMLRDGSGDDGNDDARRRWYCNEPNE